MMSLRVLNIAWWAAFMVSVSIAVKAGAACYQLSGTSCRDEICFCANYSIEHCENPDLAILVWVSCSAEEANHQFTTIGNTEGYNPQNMTADSPNGCGHFRYVFATEEKHCILVEIHGVKRCLCGSNPQPNDWVPDEDADCGQQLFRQCAN